MFQDINPDNIIKENEDALTALGNEESIIFTKEQIIHIHDRGINDFGGSFGIRDENLFDSVCNAPYQSVFGSDLYPTAFDKAAKYLLDFARYQVFIDGNKRTGYLTCLTYLKANSIKLTLSPHEMYNLTMGIANNRITEVEDISNILKKNAVYQFGRAEIDTEDIEHDFE